MGIMLPLYNDTSKPLVLLGSNANLAKLADLCDKVGIHIHGVIDQDYWNNTLDLEGIPVIGSEEMFSDPEYVCNVGKQFNFFCAVNWMPVDNDVMVRNRKKRNKLLGIIEQNQLPCVSLVHPKAEVSKSATIGQGVLIDSFVMVEGHSVIGDFSSVYGFTGIGHHTTIGRNSVLQRHVSITGGAQIGKDVYIGTASKVLKGQAIISDNTFIHECVALHRNTLSGEIVGLTGTNQRRVSSQDLHI